MTRRITTAGIDIFADADFVIITTTAITIVIAAAIDGAARGDTVADTDTVRAACIGPNGRITTVNTTEREIPTQVGRCTVQPAVSFGGIDANRRKIN